MIVLPAGDFLLLLLLLEEEGDRNSRLYQMWCCTLVILTPGRLRQEDCKFAASLGLHIEILSKPNQTQSKNNAPPQKKITKREIIGCSEVDELWLGLPNMCFLVPVADPEAAKLSIRLSS